MDRLSDEYVNHQVFTTLKKLMKFYDDLSFNSFRFMAPVYITEYFNIDDDIYRAIGGTIESVCTILKNGRINDAYTLLRKYDDAILIDTFKSIVLNKEANQFIHNILIGSKEDKTNQSKIRAWILLSKRLYSQARDIEKEINKNQQLREVKRLMKEDDKNFESTLNSQLNYLL